MSVIKKVATSNELTDVKSGDSNDNAIKKFAVLVQDTDDYVLDPVSRLWGEAESTVQQLETLGYVVVSISPTTWQSMSMGSGDQRSVFLKQQMGLTTSDSTLSNIINGTVY